MSSTPTAEPANAIPRPRPPHRLAMALLCRPLLHPLRPLARHHRHASSSFSRRSRRGSTAPTITSQSRRRATRQRPGAGRARRRSRHDSGLLPAAPHAHLRRSDSRRQRARSSSASTSIRRHLRSCISTTKTIASMYFMSSLHGELLIGKYGSWIVELAASWAVVMIVTGLFLWWPSNADGLSRRPLPAPAPGRPHLLERHPLRHRNLRLFLRPLSPLHWPSVGQRLGVATSRPSATSAPATS